MNLYYKKLLLCIAALFTLECALMSLCVFSEIPLGKGTLNARFYSKQRLVENDSKLNPKNIFAADNGFYGTEFFTLGYSLKGERLSFHFNDFGYIKANRDPDFHNSIGELYGSLQFGAVFVDIGKKRIHQSLSYFKSPINFTVDTAGTKNHNETQFSEGKIMAHVDIFSNYGFLGISYIPKIDFSKSIEQYVSSSQVQQGLLRYDFTVHKYTMGIAVSKDDFWRLGTHVSTTLGDYVEVHFEGVFNEQKTRTALSVAGGLAFQNPEPAKNRYEALLGCTANLPWFSGIVEYYYNQAGLTGDEWRHQTDTYRNLQNTDLTSMLNLYNLGMAYQALSQNRDFNSRHYLMLRLSNPTTDDYQIALNTVVNLQDFSGVVMPSMSYSGWNHISLEAHCTKSFGSPYSEFSLYGETWSCGLSIELWL
ncbi:MAG TPA: hypothetical protein VJ861_10375 [Treponemataceae bacterium]|nr:hypothetical protein [Treponemataceae bacterium]